MVEQSPVKKKRVAVIGGGVSGLAAAKAFKERGHEVLAFERSHDIGGVWELSRSYPAVQTQSPKELYRFTDLPMPEDYPEWPKGPQVHAYLHRYADKHGLGAIYRLNTRVNAMHRRSDGAPGWTLKIEDSEGKREENVDFVALCTGQFSDKHRVGHSGMESFTAAGGEVMHSSEYLDPSAVAGKRVVVLGGSKSATDIAVNAANNGAASTTLVYRENVWRVPYFVGGINFKRLLYMRAQEGQFNGWSPGPVAKAIKAIGAPLVWANFRGLEALLKAQLGLKKWGMVPDTPIEKEASCSLPIVTPGFFEALESGALRAIRTTFKCYRPGEIELQNGECIGADTVVLATGWKLGVPVLPYYMRQKLIERDGQYRVYRLCVNPDVPDMGFVGFNSSFCTVLSAEMIANWLVRYMDGQLAEQPSDAQMREDIEANLRWRREQRPAAQVYGGLCSAPFHFRHFDELLSDMGASVRRAANPLVEYFSYPRADNYRRYLDSLPAYTASAAAPRPAAADSAPPGREVSSAAG